MTRDDAYRVVQEDAARAWSEQRPFRTVLEADERVTVEPARLDDAFSLSRALRHRGAIFDALEEIDPT